MSKLRPNGHIWADLHDREELSKEEQQADACFARLFNTADGQQALEYMHLMTTFKRNKPSDSDGALRELEAQRRFVAILEARIARHAKKVTDGGRRESGAESRDRRRRRGTGGQA